MGLSAAINKKWVGWIAGEKGVDREETQDMLYP
jgi:hypothetical protein